MAKKSAEGQTPIVEPHYVSTEAFYEIVQPLMRRIEALERIVAAEKARVDKLF